MAEPGPAVSNEDIATRLLLDGGWEAGKRAATFERQVASLAEEQGLLLSDEMVQLSVQQFLASQGFENTEEAGEWLSNLGLDFSCLINFNRSRILYESLLASFSYEQLTSWFDDRREDYDSALLSVISTLRESEAWLVYDLARESGGDFDELAWSRVQTDPRLPAGGRLEWCLRKSLPDKIADAIFSNENNDLLTPILADGSFRIYHVWQRRHAVFTPAIEDQCRKDFLLHKLSDVEIAI